jgi:SAM-dependent methyltransferase
VSEAYEPHAVDWTSEKVGRIWDFYGSKDAFRSLYFSAHSGGAIVTRVERDVELRRRDVLDFGSGRGDLLAILFRHGVAARGFEFSSESASSLAVRFAGQPLFGGVEVAAALPTPYPEESFDVVFLVEVVEHLLDAELVATVREVSRLLRVGGSVVATTPNAENLELEHVRCPDCGATFHRWQHQRGFSAQTLAALFAGAGFETTVSEALCWGESRRARVRRRLRSGAPPHLLYIGRRARSIP